MIKITYVSELQMEGENIFFCIPSCVAPWKKSAGLETVTQVSNNRFFYDAHFLINVVQCILGMYLFVSVMFVYH